LRIEELLARERLPGDFRRIVDDVHAPLAARIAREAQKVGRALTIGLCGSQGSGKSTLALMLAALLEEQGLSVAILSLDDIYLTRRDRVALGARVHPLLRTRGVPGTHDVQLGIEAIRALRTANVVTLPSFDKAADDRRPAQQWPSVRGPAQVILFEGWCVGAVAQDEAALTQPLNALERDFDADGAWRRYVNRALAGDYQRLFGELDRLILLAAPGFEVVHGWRMEQEHKLRRRIEAEGGDTSSVMSDADIARFIGHYERLTRHILAEMPSRADVVVRLDERREPVRVESK
jgi:D-glycerate 3-kinase